MLTGLAPVFVLLFAAEAVPAVSTEAPATETAAPAVPPPASADHILLPRDTPVELMATAEVSTANVLPGTLFKLRVNAPLAVGGRTIVPVGTRAWGQVVTATSSGGLGKSGKMEAKLLHIEFGEATIPLEGTSSAKGTGAGSAGVAVALSGLVGLFHRGNNAKIKAGELINGYVSEDIVLDLSVSPPRRVLMPAPQPQAN